MQTKTCILAFEMPASKLGKRTRAMLAQLQTLAQNLGHIVTEPNQTHILISLQAGDDENLTLRITNLLSERFYIARINFRFNRLEILGLNANVRRKINKRQNIPEKILTFVEQLNQASRE